MTGRRGPPRSWSNQWIGLVLLVALGLPIVHGHDLQADEPEVVTEAPGFRRGMTDKDMAILYRDNLEADFQPWMGRTLTMRHLYDMLTRMHGHHPGPYVSVIVIKGGRVYDIPLEENYAGNTVAKHRVKVLVEALSNASAASLSYPDSVFLVSMRDHPFCGSHGHGCKVPVFSIIKRWDFDRNTSADLDVLIPQFVHVFDYLVFYPWEKKYDRALMRASIKSRMPRNNTREWLAALQLRSEEGAQLLDAGITSNEHKDFKINKMTPVGMAEHARWKYLMATDGVTASSRFGKLLGINSVVLKDPSPWIEYYYRSLVPHQHYIPFDKDNVLKVLRGLQSDQPRSRRVSQAGQQFAFSFLSQHCKALYVRRAVATYNGLFTDMKEFMAGLRTDGGEEAGGSVSGKRADGRKSKQQSRDNREDELTMASLMSQISAFVKEH